MTTRTDTRNDSGLLTRSFAINWEVMIFVVLLALAIFTRFHELGDRVMSHDESLHTRFSYNLYNEGDFAHSPLMHGPILFHAVALMYSLFGDNDFTARIYTSILSVLITMSPWLFRYWLGRWGTILASFMLLISPLMMYYGRYIREDIPAIISAILMLWSILMYLSGPENQQRKARWLYILAAAMLWNLGSKETAFIYIAIIGVFLFLFWVARLIQHFANVPGRPLFHTVMIGMLLGGVMALGMYITLDIIKFDMLRATETTAFSLLSLADQTSFFLWTFLVIGSIVFVLLSTLFWVYRNDFGQINWAQVGAILLIAVAVSFTFVILEELSHTEPTSTEQPAQPLDPTAEGQTVEPTSLMRWYPMIGLWVLTIGVFVFLFITRRKDDWNGVDDKDKYGRGFWGTMDLFPEFDLIILIGTLILPWSTALFPYFMKGTEGDFARVASNLPLFLRTFIGTYVPTIGAVGEMSQAQLADVGQFWLSFIAFVPLFALMCAIGLMWNWKRWLIASAIFHGLFFFFFTTVFTNIAGLGTGWVYSLGYWLEQQGVRRGSQPQYYYLLIIMPFYEFLPVIGSVLAMFSGTVFFWRQNKKAADIEREMNSLTRLAMIWRNDTPELEGESVNEDGELEDDFSLHVEIQKAKEQALAVESDEEIPPLAVAYDEANRRLRRYNMTVEKAMADPQQQWRRLEGIPFVIFFSWLGVLNLVGYSLAGEKMPWLGTHLTMPLIFLTGWFFGRIVEQIDWKTFISRGWAVRIALVVFILGLIRSFGSFFIGVPPFAGLAQHQLAATYEWLLAVIVTGIALAVIIYSVESVGWKHIRQMAFLTIFIILSGLTFRSAWMASFINYDYATEYLVYAHAAPAVKWVLEDIRELSERITDGNDLRIAYDNEVSWPYSWYFRDFDNVIYVGENPTVQNLQDAIVIVVGSANRSKVEPIVEDQYVRFDHIRLWWPMQDYFNLTPARLYDLFDLSPSNTQAAQVRRGIFDIWWNRDYTTYGNALERDFTVENWPVADRMHFYVRKDFAAQIWEYGIGEGGVSNPLNEIEQNQCTANWQPIGAVALFTSPEGLMHPIGLDVSDDGRLYIAEEFGHRISTFTLDGAYLNSFGTQGTSLEDTLTFTRPNSIDVGADGNLYIADTWNYRIQVLSPDLEPITSFGQAYTGGFDSVLQPLDGFWGPRDVVVSNDGLIYVADTGNKRVRAYRLVDGIAQHQFDVGDGGSGLGQLDEPSGLVVHPIDGRLYVADTWNRRISVFTAEGVFLDTYRVRGWYEELGNRPYLAIDGQRELLYVTDPDSGRVLVYTTGGDCVGSFGQAAGAEPTLSQFGVATGITVDSEGYVYVADSELNRVLKFEPFPMTVPVEESVESVPEISAESTEESASE